MISAEYFEGMTASRKFLESRKLTSEVVWLLRVIMSPILEKNVFSRLQKKFVIETRFWRDQEKILRTRKLFLNFRKLYIFQNNENFYVMDYLFYFIFKEILNNSLNLYYELFHLECFS